MADLPFWFHPDASAEALAIHDHYFDVAPTLAEDFQSELERSRSVIARSPNTWPQYIQGTQRYLMKRFPYFVVYRTRLRKSRLLQLPTNDSNLDIGPTEHRRSERQHGFYGVNWLCFVNERVGIPPG